jgi:hypothetical protein
MLLLNQEMQIFFFLNLILLKTLIFLKQVFLIMKVFLKMLFKRISKLGNPKKKIERK